MNWIRGDTTMPMEDYDYYPNRRPDAEPRNERETSGKRGGYRRNRDQNRQRAGGRPARSEAQRVAAHRESARGSVDPNREGARRRVERREPHEMDEGQWRPFEKESDDWYAGSGAFDGGETSTGYERRADRRHRRSHDRRPPTFRGYTHRDTGRGYAIESHRLVGRNREGEHPDHTGRGPKGYQRSAEAIFEDVCERLTDDPYVDASEMTVEVGDDGIVALEGRIDSRRTKRRAEAICDTVRGVRDVDNDLTITEDFFERHDIEDPSAEGEEEAAE
jgi:hypothetical protein